MRLLTKIVVFFLLLTLPPLLIGEYLLYRTARQLLIERAALLLEVVANIQKQRVTGTIDDYVEAVQFIAARIAVGKLDTNSIGEQSNRQKFEAILQTLQRDIRGVLEISVYDPKGIVVVSTNRARLGVSRAADEVFLMGKRKFHLHELFKDSANILRARLCGPLRWADSRFGIVEVVMSTSPLVAITEDYTGLGQSGETTIVVKNDAGAPLFITPLRFDSGAALRRVATAESNHHVPAIVALLGREQIFTEPGTIDYRGRSIIAATRYIPTTEWGVVAKMDRSEVLAPAGQMIRKFSIIVLVSYALMLVVLIFFARRELARVRPVMLER